MKSLLVTIVLLATPAQAFGPRCEIRGMAYPVDNTTAETEIEQALQEIKELGFNTILLRVEEVQEDVRASVIAPDPDRTLAVKKLERAIRLAKARDLRVALMPVVLLNSTRRRTEWRGVIDPRDLPSWFHSYGGMILKYAEIGAEQGVDYFSVGSELVSMERHADFWRDLIRDVRSRFKGKVFYSSNWDFPGSNPAWSDLDWIGLNAYFELNRESRAPSPEELGRKWKSLIPPIETWAKRIGKPLVITEVGYPSRKGALADPWDHLRKGPVDLDLQRVGYESFLESWAGVGSLAGIFVYEWSGKGGPSDAGYTPRGKPVRSVLEKWMQHL